MADIAGRRQKCQVRFNWFACFLFILLCFSAGLPVRAEVAVPELNRRVTDLTGTLTPDTVNRLESTLAQFEAAKGSQIAVLMLPTTKPEDIAEYGIRVADQWKVGRKGVDDGVILIVAKDDRRVRIEVGYGLEGVIPDLIAKRIIEEDILPRFKQGDFSGGVEAGVSRMMRLIEGEPLPPPRTKTQKNLGGFFETGILFIILGIFAGAFLDIFLGKGTASVLAGLGAGGLAWIVSGLFLVGIVVAVIVLIGVLGRGHGGGNWSSGGCWRRWLVGWGWWLVRRWRLQRWWRWIWRRWIIRIMVSRILKHLFMPPWLLHKNFPASLLGEIESAIRESEKSHSGEIRFAVEMTLSLPALFKDIGARQAAIEAFSSLRVWDTENNSGVLIYLLLADHDIEIVADRGIASKVDQREWDDIASHMEQHYRAGNFREGSLEGIRRVTELLAHHFQPGDRNPNELPDKPVLLK